MRGFFIAVVAIAALSGCEAELRSAGGAYLEPPNEQGRYRWRTFADPVYPIDSEKAEAARLRQLGVALAMNGACPAGYVVENRQATRRGIGPIGETYDLFYSIKCK